MPTHADLLTHMPRVHAALTNRYKWFIHTTPEQNLERICREGLRPNRDQRPYPEATAALGEGAGSILCLHPLGARLCPGGAAANLLLPLGAQGPRRISLALASEDLPNRVGLDWSYDWPGVQQRLAQNPNWTVEEAIVNIATEYGSIASYLHIEPNRLRVFCVANQPANPLSWVPLTLASARDVFRQT